MCNIYEIDDKFWNTALSSWLDYTHICVCIYIYIHMFVCVCMYNICMYVCMYIYISCTYVHIIYTPKVSWVGSNLLYLAAVWLLDYVCIYADIYIHIYIYTYTHIHTYTHIPIYAYAHTRIYTYTYTHTHTHIYIYTYIRIYIYIYVYIYTYIYIYVYTYIYTYITYLRLLGATSKRGIWKANDINIAIWKLDETGDGVPRATWISAAVTLSQWKTRLERSNVQDIWVCLKIVYP